MLLQARRPEDCVRDEERDAFASQLNVHRSQIRQIDILTDVLDVDRIQESHAILVGGAGEYGVVDPEPAVQHMIDFLVKATERDHPIFASCFGFQALVSGLGAFANTDRITTRCLG